MNSEIKPDYYRSSRFDVIDITNQFQMNFNLGNVLKYIVRAGNKNPQKHLEDLTKAKEYLEREIKYIETTQIGL